MIRKLQSKKEEEKRRKKTQRWLGIGLIFVMFGSVFGVVVAFFSLNDSAKQKQETFMGYDLNQGAGLYVLTIGSKNIYLNTNPNKLNSFNYNLNFSKIVTMYSGKPLYIDSKDTDSYQSLNQNLFSYSERISPACINELDCNQNDVPIKTCENNIINIRNSNENKIYEDDNCIYIEATNENIQKMTDIFLLKIFGII